ncbi:MAG: Gentisate 1,2-dioxygenase, partial [Rhizobacter sp.]|nr:Gentisate 1,2-dioxygenase [Rhizobacter sp.]
STSNQIFIVVAGEGHSLFGDREAGTARGFDWKPGDVLAAPSWIAQEHAATSGAVLLRVSDAPVMRAMRWLRSGAMRA